MSEFRVKNFLIGIAVAIVIAFAVTGGAIADRLFGIKPLDYIFPRKAGEIPKFGLEHKILTEESVIINVAEKVSPSVVTVSIESPRRRILEFNPFGGFQSRIEGGNPQDIGTGFIVSAEGLIVTNKHVVSVDKAKYKVITKDNKEYPVEQINLDPANDVAILKINASGLTPVEMGDSGNLKVGQLAIAIGTALGEFRHSVTKGVISGLGRGISAGNPYQGYVERLDDVIQTDAAINPGNSGGPLLNSAGQVIGVNVAVAQGAQNIGFAIPIDVVKKSLDQFNTTGKFPAKPYLGVQYQMISRQTALINNVPQGALVVDVVANSPAQKADVKVEDIIVKIDGEEILEKNGGLAEIISKKKAGDEVKLEIWRDGETKTISAILSEFSQ